MVTVAEPVTRLTPEEVADQMVRHERMVLEIARFWFRRNPHLGLDAEDVAQAVRLGFLEGAERFDPARGYTFATYCRWYALRAVRAYVHQECARGMRVPLHHGRTRIDVLSEQRLLAADGRPMPLAEAVYDRADRGPAERPADFWDALRPGLTERQHRTLVLHYRDELTYAEIGAHFGTSKEAVRQNLKAALDKLRGAPVARRLKEDAL